MKEESAYPSIPALLAHWHGGDGATRMSAPLDSPPGPPANTDESVPMPDDEVRTWLCKALEAAVRLEFATIPPYLCALWSIKRERDVVATSIREIVQEEMLHMAFTCNLLSAIGESPRICDWRPKFPGPLPGDVHVGLNVQLQGFNDDALKAFVRIEAPHSIPDNVDVDPSDPAVKEDATIGQFYDAILAAFRRNQL